MTHHHMLVDTCIWLDLAVDPVAEEIVNQLEILVNAKTFTLIVPEIIEEEFDRHKADCASKLCNKISKRVQETLKYARDYGDLAQNQILLPSLEAFKKHIGQVPNAAQKMVDRLDRIIRHPENKRVKTSSTILERAALRGCQKKAPFIQNRNNVADAVIIESFLELKSQHREEQDCTFSFVTGNKSDFCDTSDQRKPHPELADCLSSGEVRFSINIAEEINTVVVNHMPQATRSKHSLPSEIVNHVASWPGVSNELTECPRCKQKAMEYIGGHPSRYGGWTVWQMCGMCGFKWDTGEFID